MKGNYEKNKKIVLSLFVAYIIISVLIYFGLLGTITTIFSLIMLGVIIAGLIYSIKMIKEQKTSFSIIFTIIFGILLLIYFGGFLIGLAGLA